MKKPLIFFGLWLTTLLVIGAPSQTVTKFRGVSVSGPVITPPVNVSGTAIDLSAGSMFSKSLGADTTFTFANPTSGMRFTLILTNGASWTATFPTVTWLAGSPPVLDTGAGTVNAFSFYYDGAKYYGDVGQKSSPTLDAIAALANSTGALTNDGAGALGWYDYSAVLAPKANPTFTGTATVPVLLATKSIQQYQGTLTHAGTVTLDFDATTTVNSIALTGNVTFATSNLATNRTYRLRITGTSTNAAPTFPATWDFLGGAPSTITASKVGILELEAWGTTDADVTAAYAEAQ